MLRFKTVQLLKEKKRTKIGLIPSADRLVTLLPTIIKALSNRQREYSLRAQVFRRIQKYQVFDLRPSKKITSTGSVGENVTSPKSNGKQSARTPIYRVFRRSRTEK